MSVSSVYCGNYVSLVETRLGDIYVDTRDASIAGHLMLGREWESAVSSFVLRYVTGTVFLDIGANFGWYSLLASRFGAKQVVAFEANPEVCELLIKTFSINGLLQKGSARIRHGAVVGPDAPEEIILNVDRAFLGGGSVVWQQDARLSPPGERFCQHKVRTLQIDDLPWATNERYFIKLDIEGAEESALWGARRLIEGTEDVQLLIEYNGLGQGLIDWLVAQDFQFRHVAQEGGVTSLAPEDVKKVPQTDMIYAARFR